MIKRLKPAVLLLTVATVLAACSGGGGGGSSADDKEDRKADETPATEETRILGSGICPQDDSEAMFAYERALDVGVPGGGDFLTTSFDQSVQLSSSDEAVAEFLHELASDGVNDVWESFSALYFDTVFDMPTQTFTVNSVDYLGNESAVIVFTVDVDSFNQVIGQVIGSAQFAGRLVCGQGTWQVALADVCTMLGDGTGPPCPANVKKTAKAGLAPELEDAELPEVTPAVVDTVPTTTIPPTTTLPPPSPFDGFCPYVGQPCSANVTNDPDCTCVPAEGSSGFSKGLSFVACRTTSPIW